MLQADNNPSFADGSEHLLIPRSHAHRLRIQRRRELQHRFDTYSKRIMALDLDLGRELDSERALILRERLDDVLDQREDIAKEMDELDRGTMPDPTDTRSHSVSQSMGVRVSLSHLPSTNTTLFGRESELKMLDKAWNDPYPYVLSLIAWGGVGKTALVNRWLLNMGKDQYRGAECVFGWSFYSQGTSEDRQTSADQFMEIALRWFGDSNPSHGSPWERGERLAELVRRRRALLIFDGIEPLQNPPGASGGRLKDPGLRTLLRSLAYYNTGLCVVTSRIEVDDLKDFGDDTARHIEIDQLPPSSGAAYLRHLGVRGPEKALRQASLEYGGHALALTLLGGFIRDAFGGDIRKRGTIRRLTDESRQGMHTFRVLNSYAEWFQDKPELQVLRLLGLFDRPVSWAAFRTLVQRPSIRHLTEDLCDLSNTDLQLVLANLRNARLLYQVAPDDPYALDCHPLVREYFGEELRRKYPETWQEAHSRLYEFYKSLTVELPETLEEMTPLYAAVTHGCQARRFSEALNEVYWPRIMRGRTSEIYYGTNVLGAWGADLAALAAFFTTHWTELTDEISAADKASILRLIGFRLRVLGRIEEAIEPTRTSLELALKEARKETASRAAANLGRLLIIAGYLDYALSIATTSVDLADSSDDWFGTVRNRTTLAETLHCLDRITESEAVFQRAEEIWLAREPRARVLDSLWGYRYCELLIEQGRYQQVLERGREMIAQADYGLVSSLGVLDKALAHLAQGRALHHEPSLISHDPRGRALDHFATAVAILRESGQQDELPRALLARAMHRLSSGSTEHAEDDLTEALEIATGNGMRLHQTECLLAFSKLQLALGNVESARDYLQNASELIDATHYALRRTDLAKLQLKIGANQ